MAAGRVESWSVVATVCEPAELVCAFVAHYRALGAETVYLFLDRPDARVQALLSEAEGVCVTPCDSHWWGGRRPELLVMRQAANATRAYQLCRSDWLLHADADEYLCAPAPVGEVLGALGPDRPVAVVPPAERVRDAASPGTGMFDGHVRLRKHLTEPQRRALFGADWGFFDATGMLGNGIGKSFTRTGLPLVLSVHQPVPPALAQAGLPVRRGWLRSVAVEMEAMLVHFDGLTPLHWMLKMLRQGEDEPQRREAMPRVGFRTVHPRDRQTAAVHAAREDPERLRDLALRLLHADARMQAALTAEGMLWPMPVAPAAAAGAQFPELGADYGVAWFDARLRAEWGPLIATTRFAA